MSKSQKTSAGPATSPQKPSVPWTFGPKYKTFFVIKTDDTDEELVKAMSAKFNGEVNTGIVLMSNQDSFEIYQQNLATLEIIKVK